jgi:glucose dehydrogenase
MRWAFQVTPHDMWDYDAVNENILVDLPLGGRRARRSCTSTATAYGYTLDRATGEVLVAQPFVR